MSLQLPCDSALCDHSVQARDWEVPWVAQSSTQLPVSLLCVYACVCIKYIFLSSLKKIVEDRSVSPLTFLPLLRALPPTVFGSGSPLKPFLVVG